ncbi:helix-turn-helix domain-containing protein [Kutzneria kofuensis]
MAMTVLGAIERGRGPMSLTQIAAAADMATSKPRRRPRHHPHDE